MTTHLILGSSGFVGEELLLDLLNQGVNVIGVDLNTSTVKHPHFTFMTCDIRKLQFESIFKDVNVIHHCASLIPLARNKSELTSVNVEGTRHVLEVFKDLRWDHFLYYSSSAVTGFHSEEMTEEAPPFPVEEYGISKLQAEDLVREFCEKNHRPYAILRPRTIGGPGRMGLFELLFSWISKNRNVYLPGPGPELFQMIHIKDLISAVMLVVEKKATGVFNIGNFPEHGLAHDLEHLIIEAHSSSKLLSLPRQSVALFKLLTLLEINPFAPWQYLAFNERHILNTSKLRRLGWMPRYTNFQMLKESYDSYLAHGTSHASLHRRPMDLLGLGFLR